MTTLKQGAFNYEVDPECIRKTYRKSYSLDDWRGRLVLGILENAIVEYLASSISPKLRQDAEKFLFEDNEIFDVCLSILGYEKCSFRSRILRLRNTNETYRRRYDSPR